MSSPQAAPLRSVVYAGSRSLEHFMVEDAVLTLCGRRPGHINPISMGVERLPRAYHSDYCRRCYEASYAHFSLPWPRS